MLLIASNPTTEDCPDCSIAVHPAALGCQRIASAFDALAHARLLLKDGCIRRAMPAYTYSIVELVLE